MYDIWNPWHGCKKCSEGCQTCGMEMICNGCPKGLASRRSQCGKCKNGDQPKI